MGFRKLVSRALSVVLFSEMQCTAFLGPTRLRWWLNPNMATTVYLLAYVGCVCQWPYEYRFYVECGLVKGDVYVLLGLQQLALLSGPYLAWLLFQRPREPSFTPKTTVAVCLLATAVACELKRTGLFKPSAVIIGFCPSLAASLLDLREEIAIIRHLEGYASLAIMAAMGIMVDVYGVGVEWVCSVASSCYLLAAVLVMVCFDGTTGCVRYVPPKAKVVAVPGSRRSPVDRVLSRMTAAVEDTAVFTVDVARILLEAVGVLNRCIFDTSGMYPCGRVVSSIAVVYIMRQCVEVITASLASLLRGGVRILDAMLAAGGACACLCSYTVGFSHNNVLRAEMCLGHTAIAFGSTVATAGFLTLPLHRSSLAGLLATVILLWPRGNPETEYAILVGWMSCLTVMAFSFVVTGLLVSYWIPSRGSRSIFAADMARHPFFSFHHSL